MSTKPSLSPVLRYHDGPAAIAWLVDALGFHTQSDFRTPDGAVAHADLRFGPSVVGVSSTAASSSDTPWSGVRQGLYVVVTDPDAAYQRAVAAGADIAVPIADQSYGSRDFSLRDPEGHLWGFGTYDMSRGEGEPAIFPGILYRDAAAAIDWLERAIGFSKSEVVTGDGGDIVHAELQRDSDRLMVSPRNAGELGELTHYVNLFVSDPDAHCTRARAAGATIVREPHTTPYAARAYAARDAEGFVWWVSDYRPAR